MKRFTALMISTVWFCFGVLPAVAEYDPLTGLGYEEQPADTSASQGVATLDDLTAGSDTSTQAETSTTTSADELTQLMQQIQGTCTQQQIADYQPTIDSCFGGEHACDGYTSPTCLSQDSEGAEGLLAVPLSCFFECIGIKMQACKPVLDTLLTQCQEGSTPASTAAGTDVGTATDATETTEGSTQEESSPCYDKEKVLRGNYCVCKYGYQANPKTSACEFITSGADLDADGIERVNDMVAAADADPNGIASATVTVNGKDVRVGVSADPNSYGTYRYTVDGIHYAPTLAGAISPGFWSRVGNGVLDGSRRALSMLSPFNWFTGRYAGDDKDTKYKIGREVIYDDIDAQRGSRVKYVKYMNDFLNGMAMYMDLRRQGKTPQQIAGGSEDLNVEILHAVERMRTAATPTSKTMSDEDKSRVLAAHDHEMYRAFEDGYLRYQLRLNMQAAQSGTQN